MQLLRRRTATLAHVLHDRRRAHRAVVRPRYTLHVKFDRVRLRDADVGEVVLREIDEEDRDLVLALDQLLRRLLELLAHLVAPPELLLLRREEVDEQEVVALDPPTHLGTANGKLRSPALLLGVRVGERDHA